jgi:hypothetical protein
MARPEVRISYVRWSADCDECGVLDDGLSKAEARKVAKKHRERHCKECGWLRPDHIDNCTERAAKDQR